MNLTTIGQARETNASEDQIASDDAIAELPLPLFRVSLHDGAARLSALNVAALDVAPNDSEMSRTFAASTWLEDESADALTRYLRVAGEDDEIHQIHAHRIEGGRDRRLHASAQDAR